LSLSLADEGLANPGGELCVRHDVWCVLGYGTVQKLAGERGGLRSTLLGGHRDRQRGTGHRGHARS
jgi:hypothetical protein